MKIDIAPRPRPRGRPREFDETKALDLAVEVFWRLGYEGASVADLTGAMGITAPSLYAAFGSKEGLYRRVLERYQQGPGAHTWLALTEEPTARGAIERVLRESARAFTRRKQPPGCMISTGVLRCAEAHQPVADLVAGLRSNAVKLVRERIARGIAAGELPLETDAGALARYFGAVVQGMSIQAQDGASEAELLGLVEVAMRAWNGGAGRPRAR
ncbi:TetR/AcrR family transcriptional regulator [Myxococcus sp. CA056]|uniref:TetR/AcrR family transcriptional regulator n=1 Tax=Myxococcus sp. CA056 TaxID=2741740 RepID=UPI00157B4361|nr:TetR/AcrR family transcriptional regulator [Myxococcus sp. CA056]NTX11281.1 TetR/AcrR family transcriptional regulator [Myxococcus sp. CA056]